MELKHFYFIADSFYEDFPDPALMKNKEDGHGRPCFLAIQDNDGLFWMIPISSKVAKFKAIFEHKTKSGKRCDTIAFAEVLGNKRAFLIQNMFPIVEKYICGEYIQKSTGNPVQISDLDAKEILEKFKRILALVKHGNKNLVFPDVLLIAKKMQEQSKTVKTIYFAGGCFWGVEKYFSMAKGVISTKVGYANGTKDNPSYHDLKSGLDDASETVKIDYDENIISLEKLLELYLRVVDPYSKNKQGEDEGIQYRSGIYYLQEEEKKRVLAYFSSINLTNYAIEILPLKKFFDAEEYHQNYLNKNPQGYCHINMAKLKDDERK